MHFDINDLPSALRSVAEQFGLEFVPTAAGEAGVLPIACSRLPLADALPDIIAGLPISANFHRAVLDMDKSKDQEEYTKIMSYLAAGYGARLVYQERKFITKRIEKNGKKKKRIIQRIFLEYYAPYRTPGKDNQFCKLFTTKKS
jgi:hypothetical protein